MTDPTIGPAVAKTLLVLRHAKSDWGADFGHDLTRPLSKRGWKSAAVIGRFLATVGQVPDLVLCSPAVRARQTVERAVASGEWDCPVETSGILYHAVGANAIVDELQSLRDAERTVMLVGHEPTSSDLIAHVVGGGNHRLPTAGLARIETDATQWRELGRSTGRLEWLVTPRLLIAAGV